MRVLALGLIALSLMSCSAPARIELKGRLPEQVLSMQPLELPVAVVYDHGGGVLKDAVVEVTTEPLGIAELRGTQLIPRSKGDIVVIWKTANGRTNSQPMSIRSVDEVKVRCLPSCRGAIGETLSIQATAYADGKPQTQLEVPLRIDDPKLARLDDTQMQLLAAGSFRITADLDGVTDSKVVEVRRRADAVSIECPTIFTKTAVDNTSTIDVCYVTKGTSLEFRAAATAGGQKIADERVTWAILNERIADVSSDGKVRGITSGQTTMKVALASAPHIFKQVSIYVDEPRALDRLFRSRSRVTWSYRTPTRTGYRTTYTTYSFYAPQCRDHKSYGTRAFAWVGGRDAPLSMTCQSSEAVSCAAEAGHALSVWGLSSAERMRGWLGPCCCLTDDDRAVLDEQEAKLRGKE